MFSAEDILSVIEEVKDLPTIVEGKRDIASLRRLGFTNVIEIDKPLYEVVEQFNKGETVQILTDLDDEGRSLYSSLYNDLTRRGVHIDNILRHLLFKTPLSHIEGLDSYIDHLRT